MVMILFVCIVYCGLLETEASCKIKPDLKIGLVNYWPINGDTNDYVGNSDMFGLVNAKLTLDRYGMANSAIRFESGYTQVPNGAYFNGDEGFTVMAWIKPRNTDIFGRIFDFGNGPDIDSIVFTYSVEDSLVPRLKFMIGHVHNRINYDSSIKLNEWTHLAVTNTQNEAKIYQNGLFVKRVASLGMPVNKIRTRCYFGKSNYADDALANADIDDIKFFNISLSDKDVYLHYISSFGLV